MLQRAWQAGLLLTLATTVGSAQTPSLGELMREKMDHAQSLLRAVVLADHTRVERDAEALVRLSEASTWSPLQTSQYLDHASRFRVAARSLAEAARARETDGVSLAYMEVTLSCVQCHRHVRGARLGD